MLLLLGNLIAYGVDLGFDTRLLALYGLELLTIHILQPGKSILLGRVSEIEVHVAMAKADKHRHDKIIATIALRFETRLTHDQDRVIGFELTHALLCGDEI